MIFIDTGAFFALVAKRDPNHTSATEFYRDIAGREPLVTSLPVVTETSFLLCSRLGELCANKFLASVSLGLFALLDVGLGEIKRAVKISEQCADAHLGFVDCSSLTLLEAHGITEVFTFDRRRFALYKPAHTPHLNLLPG